MGLFATLAKGNATITSIISQYADRIAETWQEWPTDPHFSEHDLACLHALLEQNKVPVFKSTLISILNEEIKKRRATSFKLAFCKYTTNATTKDDFISLHIQLFGDPNKFKEEFLEFMASINMQIQEWKFLSSYSTLKNDIETERLASIARSIISGKSKPNKPYSFEEIDKMTGLEFENFIKFSLEKKGVEVQITKQSGDQGADLVFTRMGYTYVLQAKRYTSNVGNAAVQEVVAAKHFYGAHAAIVCTNAFFTQSAIELARANQVELWDRNYLSMNFIG